jgi:hypothetical protein
MIRGKNVARGEMTIAEPWSKKALQQQKRRLRQRVGERQPTQSLYSRKVNGVRMIPSQLKEGIISAGESFTTDRSFYRSHEAGRKWSYSVEFP